MGSRNATMEDFDTVRGAIKLAASTSTVISHIVRPSRT